MKYKSLVLSKGILRIPHLDAFLPELQIIKKTCGKNICYQRIIGWGHKPTTQKAKQLAKKHHLPYVALEDGFLRSIGLGVDGYPPYSLVYDDVGIYYDTSQPSRLEQLILTNHTLSTEQLTDAQHAMQLLMEYQLSKYNHAPQNLPTALIKERANAQSIVLVIDQTFGDMAVQYGSADGSHFQQMLDSAIKENPDSLIWVKTHPDVLTGKKMGYLTQLTSPAHRIRFIAEDINPIVLLKAVDKVYCVTSQMGFEALLLNKPVTTFGVPWYAGWGLTDDRHPYVAELQNTLRRQPRELVQLFAAAYMNYARYIHPLTGQAGSIFDVMDYLKQIRSINNLLRGEIYIVGTSLWKRSILKPFLRLPSCRPHFISSLDKLKKTPLLPSAKLLVWGEGHAALLTYAQQQSLPIIRIEDGFIRSVGLGSNLTPPLSLVMDDMGIYFNAQQQSRLEHILQHTQFNEQDKINALLLQEKLIQSQISKYNVGVTQFVRPDTNQRLLLVPGQVEDDASIRYGTHTIRRNIDLLKQVRALNPDAYIIFKPHPDVVSGNRIGHVPESEAQQYANQIEQQADILSCLAVVDEVHTMTSLTGFEALLRGKSVHCYGMPFYAGWGLTHDQYVCARRTRTLALWQLIAGTLSYYPLYIHPNTGHFTNAACAIDCLKEMKNTMFHSPIKQGYIQKQFNKLSHLYKTIRNSI